MPAPSRRAAVISEDRWPIRTMPRALFATSHTAPRLAGRPLRAVANMRHGYHHRQGPPRTHPSRKLTGSAQRVLTAASNALFARVAVNIARIADSRARSWKLGFPYNPQRGCASTVPDASSQPTYESELRSGCRRPSHFSDEVYPKNSLSDAHSRSFTQTSHHIQSR